ncbi:hypothetical protein B296_00026716 [Ensete ventricosum]|uniref:Uncharacterized protein n=1 Tax=Ensete ventricosum TaxID=4639 RepID=A0A427A8C2_ENSVE|nr:hypothetical protein B296_00026716 [Ensete ventricosum]
MGLGTHLQCIGSSPRVLGACQDGAREFARRRPRLTRRLLGEAEKYAGSWEGLSPKPAATMVLATATTGRVAAVVTKEDGSGNNRKMATATTEEEGNDNNRRRWQRNNRKMVATTTEKDGSDNNKRRW